MLGTGTRTDRRATRGLREGGMGQAATPRAARARADHADRRFLRVATVLVAGVPIVLGLASGLVDDRLQRLRHDPMATVEIARTHQVDGFTRRADPDGGLLGKPANAKIYRELRLERYADGPAAIAAAVEAAKDAGWNDGRWVRPGRSYLAARVIRGVPSQLTVILTEDHGVERSLYPHPSLLIYLEASNADGAPPPPPPPHTGPAVVTRADADAGP
jgi:hypothetical protein